MAGIFQSPKTNIRGGQVAITAKHIEQAFLKNSDNNTTIGKYLISPLPKQLDNGWWASSVSIRSGAGSGTHDRVLRLTRMFRDQLAAVDYALAEGRRWIGQRHSHTIPV